jgi:hypothetical protein
MQAQKSLFVFLLIFCAANANTSQPPCNILDTINITAGFKDGSGKYYHDGIVYEIGTFGEFNYILNDNAEREEVDPHTRGCICMYKPCLRVCCQGNHSRLCTKTSIIEVPTSKGEQMIDLDAKEYGVLVGQPCVELYKLERDEWTFVQVRY